MENQYVTLEIEIIEFETEDVITTSPPGGTGEGGGTF